MESEKASPRKRDTIRRLKLRRNKTKSQLMRWEACSRLWDKHGKRGAHSESWSRAKHRTMRVNGTRWGGGQGTAPIMQVRTSPLRRQHREGPEGFWASVRHPSEDAHSTIDSGHLKWRPRRVHKLEKHWQRDYHWISESEYRLPTV